MRITIIGLFVILLIGAVVFAFERILFSDASFILFRIINLGTLQIQEQRYGSFITQIFPLVGAWLHLPLNWIVVLYSASFNLFYLAVALLLVFKFKNYSLSILMSFYYVLFVSDTWFWTNNEIHQGIAWMFLFFAILFYLKNRNASLWITVSLFLVLGFLSIYTHPLVLFPAVFLWLFFMMQKKYWPFSKKHSIVFSSLLFVICAAKFIFITKGEHYDSEMLRTATHPSLMKIILAFFSPLAKEIATRSIWNYWLVPLLFLTGVYHGYKQKEYKPLLLTAGFCIAYLLAICITFERFFTVHIESELMPLSIIAATPFVYYTLPTLRMRQVTMVLAAIFLIRLAYMGASAEKFVKRKEWLYATLQTMREQKITKGIIYEDSTLKNKLLMRWGTPAESLIASALQHDRPNLTFVVGRADVIHQRITSDTHQMTFIFYNWSDTALNKHYFNLDTTAVYKVIAVHPK